MEPTGADLLRTLISLLEKQEGCKIHYTIVKVSENPDTEPAA